MSDWYKFRGWDAVGNKGWVYGDLVHNKKVTTTGLEDRVMVGGYEVVPESVGLFTGLKDSKGVEIFEGDIVRDITEYPMFDGNKPVEWVYEYAVFGVPTRYNDHCFLVGEDVEVIGNVFENKENEALESENQGEME